MPPVARKPIEGGGAVPYTATDQLDDLMGGGQQAAPPVVVDEYSQYADPSQQPVAPAEQAPAPAAAAAAPAPAPAPAPAAAPYGPPPDQGYTDQTQTAPASAPAPAASESYTTNPPTAPVPTSPYGSPYNMVTAAQSVSPPIQQGVNPPTSPPGYAPPDDQHRFTADDLRRPVATPANLDRYATGGYGQTGYGAGTPPTSPDPLNDPQASYRQRLGQEQVRQQMEAAPAPRSMVSPDVRFAPNPPTSPTSTYNPDVLTGTGLANSIWDTSVEPRGYTTQDLADARQANVDANSGPTRGRSELGVALGLPYLGLGDIPMVPDIGLPSGGQVSMFDEAINPPTRPLEPVTAREPGVYPPGFNRQGGVNLPSGRPAVQGPGLRPSGGLSSANPAYGGTRAEGVVPAEPVIVPERAGPAYTGPRNVERPPIQGRPGTASPVNVGAVEIPRPVEVAPENQPLPEQPGRRVQSQPVQTTQPPRARSAVAAQRVTGETPPAPANEPVPAPPPLSPAAQRAVDEAAARRAAGTDANAQERAQQANTQRVQAQFQGRTDGNAPPANRPVQSRMTGKQAAALVAGGAAIIGLAGNAVQNSQRPRPPANTQPPAKQNPNGTTPANITPAPSAPTQGSYDPNQQVNVLQPDGTTVKTRRGRAAQPAFGRVDVGGDGTFKGVYENTVAAPDVLDQMEQKGQILYQLGPEKADANHPQAWNSFDALVAAGVVSEDDRASLEGRPLLVPAEWLAALGFSTKSSSSGSTLDATTAIDSGAGSGPNTARAALTNPPTNPGGVSSGASVSGGSGSGSSSNYGGAYSSGSGGYGSDYYGGGEYYASDSNPPTSPYGGSPWDNPIFDRFNAVSNSGWPFTSDAGGDTGPRTHSGGGLRRSSMRSGRTRRSRRTTGSRNTSSSSRPSNFASPRNAAEQTNFRRIPGRA